MISDTYRPEVDLEGRRDGRHPFEKPFSIQPNEERVYTDSKSNQYPKSPQLKDPRSSTDMDKIYIKYILNVTVVY